MSAVVAKQQQEAAEGINYRRHHLRNMAIAAVLGALITTNPISAAIVIGAMFYMLTKFDEVDQRADHNCNCKLA